MKRNIAIIKNAKRFRIEMGVELDNLLNAEQYYLGSEYIVEFDNAGKIVEAVKRNEKSVILFENLGTLPKYISKLVKSMES